MSPLATTGSRVAALTARDRVVLRFAAEPARAGAAVNREELHARFRRDARDAQCVPVVRIPTGADLQGHRNLDRRHHRVEDARHQLLVAEERRPGRLIADLLCRATHIDVDDLGATTRVVPGGIRHHGRIRPGDLHRDRRGLAAMVHAAARLLGRAQPGVRGHHLRDREPGTEALAELAEGPIGHACHRRDKKVVPQHVRADVHPSRGEETYERSAILRSKVSPRKQKSCAKRGKKSQSTCARVARARE